MTDDLEEKAIIELNYPEHLEQAKERLKGE